MADIVNPATRSRMMSKIRGKDTRIEILVRSGLHRRGLRFRLHKKSLPGKPDLYLAKYHAAIFVHGCFWHLHECHLSNLPKTRIEFWETKLTKNKLRDERNVNDLLTAGVRVMTIWECALRNKNPKQLSKIFDEIIDWLNDGGNAQQITGGQ
jgi:DNA mismatch endonuclease, patch repair protein